MAVPQEVASIKVASDHHLMTHERRVVDDEQDTHFITFSVYRRRRLLDHDQAKRILLGWLNERLDQYSSLCVGFVVMPDHVHSLIWMPHTGLDAAHGAAQRVPSQLEVALQLGAAGLVSHASGRVLAALRGRGSVLATEVLSFEIYDRPKLEEKLSTIHENPVRAGLVEQAVDWKWSSARWYENRHSVGVPIHWVE